MNKIRNICILCAGNIFRSPSFEIFLKELLKWHGKGKVNVFSAGEKDRAGKIPDKESLILAKRFGFPEIRSHKPRQITEEDVKKADLILVMGPQLKKNLISRFSSSVPDIAQKTSTIRGFITGKENILPERALEIQDTLRLSLKKKAKIVSGLKRAAVRIARVV
ncbi:MAG: hypothetical protein HYW05_01500 [Candidatus Diapherotrites archaeon]|nr:hypothetical protein [Candidatus Diapherotrites archaeon]